MNIQEELNPIFEQSRSLLLQSEPISTQIEKITHPQLKAKLREVARTCQADLLILNDVLIGAMECETDSDIELILS
ncbi:hypothetical protein C0389_00335 [bacterium]|nr:hypothetical protein [bacterium]